MHLFRPSDTESLLLIYALYVTRSCATALLQKNAPKTDVVNRQTKTPLLLRWEEHQQQQQQEGQEKLLPPSQTLTTRKAAVATATARTR